MNALQFNIGTNVQCTDDACGTLSKVVVDPETDRVEEIIVDVESGLLSSPERYVVSIEDVERATDQGVKLSISSDALRKRETYEEKEVEKPRSSWRGEEKHRLHYRAFWSGRYGVMASNPGVASRKITVQKGVPAEDVVVEQGTPVRHRTEELGTVDHVLVKPETGEITHVVLRQQGTLNNYVVIAKQRIKEIGERSIAVDVSRDELIDLPRYTPRDAAELKTELRKRLRLEEAAYDLTNVDVTVDSGVVHLMGWVLDPEAKRYAEAIALSTPGVIDVEDETQIGKES
jgi:uncharacterized protein YrrD